MKELKLFIYREGDNYAVLTEREFEDARRQFEIPDRATMEGLYGEDGRWYTIEAKPSTKAQDVAIKSKARKTHPTLGFVLDDDAWASALIAGGVEKWDLPWRMDAVDDLPITVANSIERLLNEHFYGGLSPFFSKLSNYRPGSSGDKTPTASPMTTSTTA